MSGTATGPVPRLDHLIVFLPGPVTAVAGLVLDPGTRHLGQGTRNRRILFPDDFIELLWVDVPADARASGLRFVERCTGDGCPFGIVLRGRLPDRSGFVDYSVPDGPTLLVRDDPATPFLAVNETDDPDLLRPAHRAPEWVNAGTALERAEIRCPVHPDVEVPGVSFTTGEPRLTVTLAGRAEPLRFHPGSGHGALPSG
jgi:hypothetical protein